jgi:hypothetical protein
MDESRQLLRSLLARALLVEAKAEKNGALGLEVGAEKQLNGLELSDEQILAV